MKNAKNIILVVIFTLVFVAFHYASIMSEFSYPTVAPDFASYFYAANAVTNGENFYDQQYLVKNAESNDMIFPYIYPPVAANFFVLFTGLKFTTAKALWSILSCIFLSISIVIVANNHTQFSQKKFTSYLSVIPIWFVFFTAAEVLRLKHNFLEGQINIFVVLFIVLAILSYQNKNFSRSGAFIALAAMFKITPIFLLIIFINKNNAKKVLAGFILCSAACFLCSGLVFGFSQWKEFFMISGSWSYGKEIPDLYAPSVYYNLSIAGFFARIFGDNSMMTQIASIAAIIALWIYLSFSFKNTATKHGKLLMLLPILIGLTISSPITYGHHFIFFLAGIIYWMDYFLFSMIASVTKRFLSATALIAGIYFSVFHGKWFTIILQLI